MQNEMNQPTKVEYTYVVDSGPIVYDYSERYAIRVTRVVVQYVPSTDEATVNVRGFRTTKSGDRDRRFQTSVEANVGTRRWYLDEWTKSNAAQSVRCFTG